MAGFPRDGALAQRVLLHEAKAQQGGGRELRDLGDGWLLHDPGDAEPFWNRLIAPRWPAEVAAFDRRLDEAITLFATLDRLPHVRPLPAGGEPADLAARLLASGFAQVGADRRMVLDDAGRCVETVRTWRSAPPKRYAVERHPEGFFRRHRDWAVDAALVLAEAFAVDPLRRVALETDVLACVSRRDCTILLLRDDGEPVAVARRATTDGGSYLSSIGTRPAWRGRGLGSLITALAVVDAIDAGSDMVHLAVDATNESGRRFYEGLGFAVIGDVVPDLLMR